MFDFFKGMGTKVLIGGAATVGVFLILNNLGTSKSNNTTQKKARPQKRAVPKSTAQTKTNVSTLNGTPKKKRKCATLKV